jgi:hypothetical protein
MDQISFRLIEFEYEQIIYVSFTFKKKLFFFLFSYSFIQLMKSLSF